MDAKYIYIGGRTLTDDPGSELITVAAIHSDAGRL